MKKHLFFVFAGIFLVFSSCSKVETDSLIQDEMVLKSGKMVLNFNAHLSGDQEVPANNSQATGEVIFQLSKDGTELSYKLIVANLENVRMSHIHLAQAGVNGGVVVWLYPSAPPMVPIPGTTNGILAQGVITSANLTGALAGKPLADLVTHLKAGNAYANVHTDQFPGGEIRGQISAHNSGMMN